MSRRLPIPHPSTGAFPPDLSLPGNCSPSDIIYCSSPEPDEDDEARNLSKRRRIEYHADRYLRGETLYLHSARLRGPVINNPWAKQKLSERPGNVQTKTAATTTKGKGGAVKKKSTNNSNHPQQQTNLKEKLKSSKSKNDDGVKEMKGKKGNNEKRERENGSASLTDDAEEVLVAASVKGLQSRRVSTMAQDTVVFDSPHQPLPTYDIDSIPSTRQQMEDDDGDEEEEGQGKMNRPMGAGKCSSGLFDSKVDGRHQVSAQYSPSTTLKQNLPRITATRANVQAPPSPTPHANARKRKAPPPRPRSELPLKKQEVGPQSFVQPNRAALFAKSVAKGKQKDAMVEEQIVREKRGNQAAAFAALSPFEFRYTKAQAPRASIALSGKNKVMQMDDSVVIDIDADNNEDVIPFRREELPKKKRVASGLATFSPGTAYRGKKPKTVDDTKHATKRLEPMKQADEDDEESQDDASSPPPPPKRARKETTKTTKTTTSKADAEAPSKARKRPAPKPKAKTQPKPKKKADPAPKPKAKPNTRVRGKNHEENEKEKVTKTSEGDANIEELSAPDGKDGRQTKDDQVSAAAEAEVMPAAPEATLPKDEKSALRPEVSVEPAPVAVPAPRKSAPQAPEQNGFTEKANLSPTKEAAVVSVAQVTANPVTAQSVPSLVKNQIPGNLSPVSPLDGPVTHDINNGFPATLPSPLEVRSRTKTVSPRKPVDANHQNTNVKQKGVVALSDNEPPQSSRLSSPPPSSELDREESTIEMSSGRFRDALMHSAQKAQSGTEDDIHLPEDAITPHVPLNTQAEFLAAANSFNRCLANSPVKFADYTPAPVAQDVTRQSLSFTAINSPDRPAASTVDDKEQAKRRLFRTSPLKNNHFTPFSSIDQNSPSKRRISFFGASTQKTSHSFNAGAYSPLTYSPFASNQVPVSPSRGGAENPPMPSQSPIQSGSTNWLDDVLGQTEAYLEKDTWNIEQEAKVEAARKTPATTRKGKIISSQTRLSSQG